MQRRSTGQLYLDGKLQPGQGFEAAPQQQYSEQQYVASAAHAGSNGALHRQLGAVLTQHAQHDAASPTYSSGDEERGAGTKARAGARPATPLTPASLRRNSRLALLSMLLLVFQGTALSIMLRYSRARAGQPYLASVSVILTEAIKLAICLAMQYRVVVSEVAAAGGGKPGAAAAARGALGRELRRQARDIAAKALPMLLPAGMFVMQQVLLVIAATHLDAVAFQIFSQSFKLVPTALFAYWLLGQALEPMQWASIPVLALGVILVTVNNGGGAAGAAKSAAAAAVSSSSHGLDYVAGMVACSVSGLSSAYAGVYFEKYVKGKHAASLWVRNIQLGLFGVPLSTAYALAKDGGRIWRGGFLQGFDAATWSVIALQVFGGLVTGMVVKYCDNILKNFALAVSVILTVLVAIPLFGQWPSPIFLAGVALVLLSVFMYGRALDARRLALHWQKAKRRLAGGAPHHRRALLFGLLAACLCLLLLTGALAGRRAAHGQPVTKQHGLAGRRSAGRLGAVDVAGAGRRAAAAAKGGSAGVLGAAAGEAVAKAAVAAAAKAGSSIGHGRITQEQQQQQRRQQREQLPGQLKQPKQQEQQQLRQPAEDEPQPRRASEPGRPRQRVSVGAS